MIHLHLDTLRRKGADAGDFLMTRPISYACPVCNGFTDFLSSCPECGDQLKDYGRFTDLLADYSPYRPIDDLKMSDDWNDVASHRCPHQVYCPQCGHMDVQFVDEIMI